MARGKKGWVGKYSPSAIRRYRDEHWVLILADPANGIPKAYWRDLLTKAECVAAAAQKAQALRRRHQRVRAVRSPRPTVAGVRRSKRPSGRVSTGCALPAARR